MKYSGAEIIIKKLHEKKVDTIFGYPGGAVIPLYDELYKDGKIEHVITAHEQGAIHAADGFARASGTAGVVFATSGPGATNLVTGVANAYLDSIPLVAITGNVATSLLGKDSFQEADIVGITQPIVKHSFMVRDIEELANILDKAFEIATTGRKGPVVVDVPKDIQTSLCEYTPNEKGAEQPTVQKCPDLTEAINAINNAKRPYIYAGGGVLDASDLLIELSEKIDAPVGLSMMGLSAMPSDNKRNLGMFGMHGKYTSIMAKSECDLIIALGVRFSDRATGDVNKYAQNRTVIHVDIDASEFGKNIKSHIDICSDAKTVLTELVKSVDKRSNPQWWERISQFSEKPYDFMPKSIIGKVSECFDKDTVVATDVGQHQMWVMQYYNFKKPRTLLTSGGLGTMGYGLGAAIGGCMANGKKQTVLFTGDGSFGMNLNELATAVSYNLPITIVLLNNGVLGMVRQWQKIYCENRYSQTTLGRKTDYVALAKAFGAYAYKTENLDELSVALENLNPDGPTLIECTIDKDEKVLPMIPPGGTVKEMMTR